MAGRQKDFIYLDDYGRPYVVLIDETNAAIPAFGFEPYLGDPILFRPPTGLRLRKAVLQHESKSFRREIVCATAEAQAYTGQVKSVILKDFEADADATFKILYTIHELQFKKPQIPVQE